jgi:hypothetical protein
MPCPKCGTDEVVRTLMGPESPHYAKLECIDGHFIKWLRTPPVEVGGLNLPPGIPEGQPLPALSGSPAQVEYAKSVRPAKLAAIKAEPMATERLLAAMRGITSASWWIANKERPLAEIRWPKEWRSEAREGQEGAA